MSQTTYLILCGVTTTLVMSLIGWGLTYVIYDLDAGWLVFPWAALMLIIGVLIDRHEHRQGTLPPPNGALDRFVYRWLLPKRNVSEARQHSDAVFHNRLDRPE
jgi:hypothetical protein